MVLLDSFIVGFDEAIICKAPASNIIFESFDDLKMLSNIVLVKAVLAIMKKKNYPTKIIGVRHGEKMHETLVNEEEKLMSKENRDYFLINPDLRDLNYSKYYELGKKDKNKKDYNSLNNKLLNVEQTIKLLKSSDFVKNLIK